MTWTYHIVRSIYRVITGRDDLGDKLAFETVDLERERERIARHSFPG